MNLNDQPTVRLGAALADKIARLVDGVYVHDTTTGYVGRPAFKRAWEFVPTDNGPTLTIYATRRWVDVTLRDARGDTYASALVDTTARVLDPPETLEALAIVGRFIQRNL